MAQTAMVRFDKQSVRVALRGISMQVELCENAICMRPSSHRREDVYGSYRQPVADADKG